MHQQQILFEVLTLRAYAGVEVHVLQGLSTFRHTHPTVQITEIEDDTAHDQSHH